MRETSENTPLSVMPSDASRVSNLGHPDDIINDKTLSQAEKRSILASWASDAHAVENAPALRLLDNGARVDIDVILRALKTLDENETGCGCETPRTADFWRRHAARPHDAILTRWRRKVGPPRRRDDDDDPPPCPAASVFPKRPRFVPAFGRLVS